MPTPVSDVAMATSQQQALVQQIYLGTQLLTVTHNSTRTIQCFDDITYNHSSLTKLNVVFDHTVLGMATNILIWSPQKYCC